MLKDLSALPRHTVSEWSSPPTMRYYLNLSLLPLGRLSPLRLHCIPPCSEPVHCEILVPNEHHLEIDADLLSTKGVVGTNDGCTVTAHYCVFNISVNNFFRRVILREPNSCQVRLVFGKWVKENELCGSCGGGGVGAFQFGARTGGGDIARLDVGWSAILVRIAEMDWM